MRKYIPLALGLILLLSACARADALTGKSDGYGGELSVSITVDGERVTSVEVTGHNETQSIAGPALEQIPLAIVEKGSPDVDIVSGATFTSKAIIAAVQNAMDPDKYPYGAATTPSQLPDSETYIGLGLNNTGRTGFRNDSEGVPIYSINQVFTSAVFDKSGRVLDLYIDQLEIATPNYDGQGMPRFSGFPGQGGYNWDENKDGTIQGKTEDTEENFLAEISEWVTKRGRGDSYRMTTGTWAQQMDTYQRLFIGKTVDEIEAWFTAYCSDINGRPLKSDSADAKDQEKYGALSEEDKAMLADVTTSATMSLNDSHGNIIASIRSAYDNRVPMSAGQAK